MLEKQTKSQIYPSLSLADGTSSSGINPEWECGLDVKESVSIGKDKEYAGRDSLGKIWRFYDCKA